MKILILNFILSTAVDGKIIRRPSNSDTMIYNMARGFVKGGHHVTLAAAADFKPLQKESYLDFDIVYFPSRFTKLFKPHLLPFPDGLRNYLKRNSENFDIVLSVESFSIPTLIASICCKDKLVIWQEMSYHQRLMRELPSKIWHNMIMPFSIKGTFTIPQSKAAQSFISKYQPATSGTCIPHGVNDDIFKPNTLNQPQKYFLVVSMLIRRKRIDRIIEKFARFIQNTGKTDYTLKIIGEGNEMNHLLFLAKSLGIEPLVEFLGFRNHTEFASIGKNATAFLVDTDRDLNMVSVSEALANGIPVLMNTVPNTAAYITSLNLGIAKPHWDWEDLNEMILRYDEFHQNCIKHRDNFTNIGSAQKIVAEFNQHTK